MDLEIKSIIPFALGPKKENIMCKCNKTHTKLVWQKL